jgi:hypothetical protein
MFPVTCLLAGLLLLAIAICALAPSAYMTEIPFIPTCVGEWADRNGNFRNFPVFAAFSALLFFVFNSLQLQTANCRRNPSTPASTSNQQLVTRYGQWHLALHAFLATALLGVALEALQLLLPGRHADPMNVFWSVLGALAGASSAAFAFEFVGRSGSPPVAG